MPPWLVYARGLAILLTPSRAGLLNQITWIGFGMLAGMWDKLAWTMPKCLVEPFVLAAAQSFGLFDGILPTLLT